MDWLGGWVAGWGVGGRGRGGGGVCEHSCLAHDVLENAAAMTFNSPSTPGCLHR